MRQFSSFDKKIADEFISKNNRGKLLTKYRVIQDFFNDQIALFISDANCAFFYRNELDKDKGLEVLVSIIVLLRDMEQEGLILCILNNQEPLLLYKQTDNMCAITTDKIFSFDIGNIDISRLTIANRDGTTILNGNLLPDNLSKMISYYFRCKIYPTETLNELIANKYDSVEIRSLKRQRNWGVISTLVAVLIAIISCWWNIYMTRYNNEHAVTEIKAQQYDEILNILKEDSCTFNSIKTEVLNLKLIQERQDSIFLQCTSKFTEM